MKRLLTGILVVCFVFSMFLVLVPNAKGTAEVSKGIPGSIPNAPPSIGNSTVLLPQPESTKAQKVLPLANILMTNPPHSLPVLSRNADGSTSWDFAPMDSPYHWWSVDYWCTTSGTQKPNYMSGSFTAVNNSISGLVAGDSIMFLPLNVLYGTSLTNCVWFQFEVYFDYQHTNPSMFIWDNVPPYNASCYKSTSINLTYVAGHVYNYSLTTSGSTITFYIQDTNTLNSWQKNIWDWTIPGTTMLYNDTAFSPSCAIEGRSTNAQISNVPYFQTETGYGITAHYHAYFPSGQPSGIDVGYWYARPNYYYWSMIGNQAMASPVTASPIGTGTITNANNLIGLPDGATALIYGASAGNGGNINGPTNANAGGEIYLTAYSTSGWSPGSQVYVYVSPNGSTWYQISTFVIITSIRTTYDVGNYMGYFEYVAVAGYSSSYGVSLNADSVYASNYSV